MPSFDLLRLGQTQLPGYGRQQVPPTVQRMPDGIVCIHTNKNQQRPHHADAVVVTGNPVGEPAPIFADSPKNKVLPRDAHLLQWLHP